MEAPAKLPSIPEGVLKKRKARDSAAAKTAAAAAKQRRLQARRKKPSLTRAEAFVVRQRQKANSRRHLARAAARLVPAANKKASKGADEGQLCLVFRFRKVGKADKRVIRLLKLLGLKHLRHAVFIRLNNATRLLLNLVEPYVVYGYPSEKTVHDLLFRRGQGRVGNNRVSLADNKIIENNLGKHNIICLEDIVSEMVSLGPAFETVANEFLLPFRLPDPAGGWEPKTRPFKQGKSKERI